MNICFIIPPAKSSDRVPERVYGCTFTYYRQPELPMLYVAAVLEKENQHSVTLKDFSGNNSWEEFCRFVDGAEYDIYIFHTVLLAQNIDTRAAQYILKNKNVKIIFFGPHPTLKPGDFLIDDRCYVARGEAEYIIKNIILGVDNGNFEGVKGLSYIKNKHIIENETYGIIENLDNLPFPARHLLQDRDEYFNPKLKERPVTLILTSRGCSFKCYYCVPNAISWARELEYKRFNSGKKPPVRLRSPENIAEEFRIVKEKGYCAVSVVDDLFLFGGKKRILSICEGLKGVGLPFGILARCDLIIDDEMVKALAEAGCKYVDLGVESLNQKILDDIGKNMDNSAVEKSISLLNKYGIEPKPNILFAASPLETVETMEATLKKISSYRVNYCMFSIATPFPGTEFAKKAEDKGWSVKPEIDDLENNLSPSEKSLVSYPGLSKNVIEKLIKRANRKFYLSPRRILFQLKKIKSLRDLKYLILIGWKTIK
jgi:radical SAM superfamily enzyme YgiQ (UPF0313 family)